MDNLVNTYLIRSLSMRLWFDIYSLANLDNDNLFHRVFHVKCRRKWNCPWIVKSICFDCAMTSGKWTQMKIRVRWNERRKKFLFRRFLKSYRLIFLQFHPYSAYIIIFFFFFFFQFPVSSTGLHFYIWSAPSLSVSINLKITFVNIEIYR